MFGVTEGGDHEEQRRPSLSQAFMSCRRRRPAPPRDVCPLQCAQANITAHLAGPGAACVCDIDSDGRAELCVGTADGSLAVWKGGDPEPWACAHGCGSVAALQVLRPQCGPPTLGCLTAEGSVFFMRVAAADPDSPRGHIRTGPRASPVPANQHSLCFFHTTYDYGLQLSEGSDEQSKSVVQQMHAALAGGDSSLRIYAVLLSGEDAESPAAPAEAWPCLDRRPWFTVPLERPVCSLAAVRLPRATLLAAGLCEGELALVRPPESPPTPREGCQCDPVRVYKLRPFSSVCDDSPFTPACSFEGVPDEDEDPADRLASVGEVYVAAAAHPGSDLKNWALAAVCDGSVMWYEMQADTHPCEAYPSDADSQAPLSLPVRRRGGDTSPFGSSTGLRRRGAAQVAAEWAEPYPVTERGGPSALLPGAALREAGPALELVLCSPRGVTYVVSQGLNRVCRFALPYPVRAYWVGEYSVPGHLGLEWPLHGAHQVYQRCVFYATYEVGVAVYCFDDPDEAPRDSVPAHVGTSWPSGSLDPLLRSIPRSFFEGSPGDPSLDHNPDTAEDPRQRRKEQKVFLRDLLPAEVELLRQRVSQLRTATGCSPLADSFDVAAAALAADAWRRSPSASENVRQPP
eukprot:TRINITY_DN18150_c0_g1_i1.p1 TRINITY_DN18150_c0_g1~~TRINITY_DN18150_c0_g1_i1.p1  ORF type:complete len:653 (+),score=146.74 TRINITY_DN18150_c0_g1_i1:73-1959(+)